MRGPVFLRTGSNPAVTPPPALPRSEAFPGEASRPSPAARLGPAGSAIPRFHRRFAPRVGAGRAGRRLAASRGGGRGRGRGRASVGSSSLVDHKLCEPIPSQPLAVSHAGHVQAFVGRTGGGEGEGGQGEGREVE